MPASLVASSLRVIVIVVVDTRTRSTRNFPLLRPDPPGRDLGVVLEQYQIVPLHGLGEKPALEGQRVHRIEVTP